MSDALLQNWSDDERWTPERAAIFQAAQASLASGTDGGWSVTEHLRFVERGVPSRFILQQLWVARDTIGRHLDFAEWRDVPSVKETSHV